MTSSLLDHLTPPLRQLVTTLTDAFLAASAELFLVGGPVRDLMLDDRRPTDLDFTTNVPPEATKGILQRLDHAGLYDIGEKFGTIGVILPAGGDPQTVEITTFRHEVYDRGSRHPQVTYGTNIVDDLARRDITINAMAINTATGELIDPWYGQADLHAGLLRAVGDAEARFAEDPLRLLRVARFVSQLGFAVEATTLAAMAHQASTLETISAERIYAEMTRLLCGPWADHALDILLETGLFIEALPELRELAASAGSHPGSHREKDLWDHTKRVVMQSPPRPIVRWAALLHDAAKPQTRSVDPNGEVHFFGHERVGAAIARRLLARLNTDKQTQKAVSQIVDLHLRPASYDAETWTDSAVRRLALEAGEVMDDLIDLAAADVTSGKAHKQRAAAARVVGLRDHLARLEAERALAEFTSPLDGTELMAMFDRAPGRWIAVIKNHLRELVLDGELRPGDKEGAATIAQRMMADGSVPS